MWACAEHVLSMCWAYSRRFSSRSFPQTIRLIPTTSPHSLLAEMVYWPVVSR
jgi:hypothetical protein